MIRISGLQTEPDNEIINPVQILQSSMYLALQDFLHELKSPVMYGTTTLLTGLIKSFSTTTSYRTITFFSTNLPYRQKWHGYIKFTYLLSHHSSTNAVCHSLVAFTLGQLAGKMKF